MHREAHNQRHHTERGTAYMLVALAPSQEGDLLHGLQQHICHQLDYDELM